MAKLTLTAEEIQGLKYLHNQVENCEQADRIKIILLLHFNYFVGKKLFLP
ncbi:MAG: hypothetical protein JNM36_00630 [Chitinophagales bacterium]|nr:hypothetical protein [Chitinophagales bacterium]